MADEWFVRVLGKEYGPVDLATLREWRAEGRLIAENEVRAGGDFTWRRASDFVEIFEETPSPAGVREDDLFRRRSLMQIIGDSFGIYARGFLPFFAFALLVAVPSTAMKISLAFVHTQENGSIAQGSMVPAAIVVISFALILMDWPIFLAGLQFATADLAARQPIRFGDLFRRATNIWPRMSRLSIAVYGAFIFWTALPVVVILSIVGSEPSVFSLLLALLALAVQVYMAGRLFINFLFWQQSATIGGLDGMEALRDSKELARSRSSTVATERPVFRGAMLASIWLLVLLGFSAAVELPFLLVRIQGITTIEEATALVQNLMNAPKPDAMTIATYILSSLVHALLRPLLGITFVLLYCDAKSRQQDRR
ncbi:MAG: DUF4339 domain-containing protein [Chthoniobacterales bacterium]